MKRTWYNACLPVSSIKILPKSGKDSVTLLGEYLEKNGKETPLCSII